MGDREVTRRPFRRAAGGVASLLAGVMLAAGVPAPAAQEGLAGRLAAARDAARKSGWESYWVAWGVRVPSAARAVSSNGPEAAGAGLSALELAGGSAAVRMGSLPDSADAVLFFRMDAAGEVPRELRVRRADAPLGSAGARVAWLGVAPDGESLALLERVRASAPEAVRREMGAAAAQHRDARGAVAFARRLLTGGEPSARVRAEAAFWLQHQRTAESLALLEQVVRRDQSARVREEAVTGIASMGTGEARALLARLAADGTVASGARREAADRLARGVAP